ncbi:MAG: GFA family protein, partial [Dongiaceae bacterium]
ACGAVRYSAAGAPRWTAHCHCRDCRRSTGTAFATYVGVARERFAWSGETPQQFHSSPGVIRWFCGRCGTPLTYQGERWADEMHVLAGTLDDPAALQPQAHVYVAHQLPWLKLADGLPRFPTTAGEPAPDTH